MRANTSRYQWLGWRDAADACFSWTNAEAIRRWVSLELVERRTTLAWRLGVLGFHASGIAQALPTVSVDRDGDTFHVRARASVAVDPRIAWDTITDYEHMREFFRTSNAPEVVARSSGRVNVEYVGQFPLFFFDIPVRVRLAVTQQPYERIVARSESGEVDGEPQTLRSFSGSYDLAVITVERRAGVRLEYEAHFELAEPLPPISEISLAPRWLPRRYAASSRPCCAR